MKIAYLDGPRLRVALLAGCDYVQHRRAELNRINVYPVPDGDTGTNLALTAASIADHLRANRDAGAASVARRAADAAILGARGNCGMILSHFLLGFAAGTGAQRRLDIPQFVGALRRGVDQVYHALERPVEGTILTVMRETAEEAERATTRDFAELIDALLARARGALERTPDLLPALRTAGVVDAGGKGFVHLLEGVVARLQGDPIVALEQATSFDAVPAAAATAEFPGAAERFRYCTEALVRGSALPEAAEVSRVLQMHGDSAIVIRSGEVLKVHVHTDEPEAVFAYLRSFGTLATHKAEDMRAQHEAVERAAGGHVQLARRPVVVVSDTACDLPDEIVRAHGIHLVPMSLIYGDAVLRDRVEIDAGSFTARLIAGERATTSQPPPGEFLRVFARAAEDGEQIVGVLVGAALSGTFASGEAAAKQFTGAPVHLVDSRGASLLQGLMALRAAELAELGKPPSEIAAELNRVRDRSGVLFTVDTFEHLLASGRVGRGRAWLGGLLDIKPVLEIDAQARVLPAGRARGRQNVLSLVIRMLEARIPRDVQRLRFGIVHVACADVAQRVRDALVDRWGEREILVNPATPVLATHLGPGAWGVIYFVED